MKKKKDLQIYHSNSKRKEVRKEAGKFEIRKEKQALFTSCVGFCVAQSGLQYAGSCAARCGGAPAPELDRSQYTARGLNMTGGILTGEIQKGHSKVCLYNNTGSLDSLTVGAASICPLTK